MYGLKNDIDLGFLNGRELIQLCIGLYQIIFKFDEDVAISVEQEFRYFDGRNEWLWRPDAGSPVLAARTTALLGNTIQKIERSVDGTLALTFSNGCRLTIRDSSKEHESYDITRPGQTIVV
jgi:hypothetical protein